MSSNRIYKPTWLYIKQHNQTGLKYFGKTTRKDPLKYMGSGTYWKDHLRVHGNDVKTIWSQLFESEQDLIQYAMTFSVENDIVNSSEWANLILENGLDGGRVGMTHSEETRKKLSNANKGRKASAETRRKISEGNSGKHSHLHTEEMIKKAAAGRIGMKRNPHSAETKKKMSIAATGREHPPMSDETKAKIAAANLGKPKAHRGKPWSAARRATYERLKNERNQTSR